MKAGWDSLIRGLPGVHILQTREWSELKSGFGWEPHFASWQDGEAAAAAAMMLLRRIPMRGFSDRLAVAYVPKGPLLDWGRAELRARLPSHGQGLGPRKGRGELVRLLDAGRERDLVATLLERYYDPLYRHSEGDRAYAVTIDSSDPARAAAEVAAWVEGART